MPSVFVIGQDWTLRAAVRAELRELGVEALGFASVADALDARASQPAPEAVVLDVTSAEADPAAVAAVTRGSLLLVVASGTGTALGSIEPDLLLKKPVRVAEIVAAVRQLMEGRPA